MSFIDQITVLVLTYNEEDNIGRTLDALKWASRILVVDSGSTDRTCEILETYSRVRVVKRVFDTFARQSNFGLSQITTEWVLSLDADYEVSADLAAEIENLTTRGGEAGFRASFIYRIYGRSLRASVYPPRVVLFRRKQAHYVDEGHGHAVMIDGKVSQLKAPIYHDDRKPLQRWFGSQARYAELEADYLMSKPRASLRRNDHIRLFRWLAPLLVFCYTLVVKRCLFDGWPGWYYVMQRTLAETMIALELGDRKLRRGVDRRRRS